MREAPFAAKHFLVFAPKYGTMHPRRWPMKIDFVHKDGDAFLVLIDLGVYGIASVLKAAYLFTDRCYVHLQYRTEQTVEARFRAKPGNSTSLDTLAREFCNELLDHALRARVAKETEGERNLILAHALSRHPLLNPELETTPAFTDPRRTAVPDLKKSEK